MSAALEMPIDKKNSIGSNNFLNLKGLNVIYKKTKEFYEFTGL
jgi:hypothetical protein